MYCICHQMYCWDSHVQYIRSPTWVYCISYHVNQESHLVYCICQLTGVLHIYAIMYMYIRSLAWVYCICQQVHWIYHQVYCRGHHAHQEPHVGVLHLPSSVLHIPSSNIRSNTGVYYISHEVYCRGHAVLQELHLGVLHLPSSVL